ncbi:hypothetical protein F5X96DRAFT_293503 [Biscogniauxia mediterranea]|nr:hypothetical protein F5X96DRAFT_293503 [Biscogniauxia mediterranea]
MSGSRPSTPTPAGRGALPTPPGSPAGTATTTTTTTTFTGEFRVPLRERVRLMRLSGGPVVERPRTPIPGPSSPCAAAAATPRTPPHQATLPSVDEDECPGAPRKANKYRLLSHKKSSSSEGEDEDEDEDDDDIDILLDRRANRLRASQLGMKLLERPQIGIASANERVKKALGSAPARESPLRNSVSRDELTTLDVLFFERLGLDSDDDASSSGGGGSDWSISGESSSVGSKTSEDSCQSSGDELLVAPGPIKPIVVDLEALETQATSQK